MTNYITSVGVQNYSIAITAGNASSALTITTVGSGAFLHFGGNTCDGTGDPDRCLAKLVLTNTSTITASKNGTTGAATATGCIIDGDTTNLIKSVQTATIAKASGSTTGTASINAVTDANTAVHSLGVTSSDTSANSDKIWSRFSLSSTTVTQTVAVSGQPVTGSFQITEYQSAALTANVVQRISAASSSSVTSWTGTISNSVTTATAYSTFGGYTTASTVLTDRVQFFYGSLTNGTTFTVNANTGEAVAKTYLASIVDTATGVLNSNVQRGTTTLTSATSGTTAISPSVTYGNAGGIYLGNTSTGTGFEAPSAFATVELTDGSTMTTKLNSSGTATSSWEETEFPAFAAAAGVSIAWITA